MKYPSQEADKVLVRLPEGWRAALKAAAAKNHRPMNGEILAALDPIVTKEMQAQADEASA